MADDDKGRKSDEDLDRTDDTDNDADDVDDTDDDADDDDKDKDKAKSDKDKSQSDKDARVAELEAQLEKRSKSVKMARADRERLEKELKQLRDKDLPEIEKLKTELAESNKALEDSKATLRQQRIDLAFLRDNTHTWRNPATALKLADLSKVDVDDDGEVSGLKAALDALAKSDPYLLADTKSDKDDDKSDKDDDGKPKGSTGSPNNRNRSGGTDKKKLVSRFPSMRTRGASG